jgi:hypothetical protein
VPLLLHMPFFIHFLSMFCIPPSVPLHCQSLFSSRLISCPVALSLPIASATPLQFATTTVTLLPPFVVLPFPNFHLILIVGSLPLLRQCTVQLIYDRSRLLNPRPTMPVPTPPSPLFIPPVLSSSSPLRAVVDYSFFIVVSHGG